LKTAGALPNTKKMKLNLKRPLVVFDIETTGTNVVKDRIVSLSALKVQPDGSREQRTWVVNPGVNISDEVAAIHGITNEMVADKPTFKEVARQVVDFIKDSDLAGYNSNKFDIPVLAEELMRAEVEFDMKKRLAIDVQNIFHRMEQRTLSAAYKFYCNKELENAHSADADTLATFEVLLGQLDRYPDLQGDVAFLSEFSNRQKVADYAGFIAFDEDDEEIFTFGKHKGKKVKAILKQDPGHFAWMLNADFPLYTKKVLTAIKLREGLK
jgi:DNA polymerase-3 subunit epsilon